MGRRKFAVFEQTPLSDSDGTVNISQTLNAYEVSTAKVLKDESDEKPEVCPEVFSASRSNWLVISIDSDIHFFNMDMGCNEVNPDNSKTRFEQAKSAAILAPEDGKLVAMRFLPNCDVLMILCSTGTLIFTTPTYQFVHKISALPGIEDCSMQIVATDELMYSACILDRHNALLYLFTIPQFDVSSRDGALTSIRLLRTIEVNPFQAQFVTSMFDSFICFPERNGALVSCISVEPDFAEGLEEMFTLREDLKMVRKVGCYVVALTSTGKLLFYDENMILVNAMTLCKETEGVQEILDFEFIDVDEHEAFEKTVKILLKVRTKMGVQFKIRQFNQLEMEFSIDCSPHALLIPTTTPGDHSNIIYVDAFPTKSPDSVFVRFISEAQPIIRLNKLLNLKRFEDALKFAKSYNLPLDVVYTAVVRDCQEQINIASNGDYGEALFTMMMRNLEQISDYDIAADLCVSALSFVNHYEHIKSILEFSKGLYISDEFYTIEIARYRYELASYRMINGTEDVHYGPKSEWNDFRNSETHKEFFDRFCEEGRIAQARLLFSRYVSISGALAHPEAITQLLATFEQTIIADPTLCPAISEFIKFDLIPVFLYTGYNPKTICLDLCDFFINISMLLEKIEPKQFPANALHFAQTFGEAIQKLKGECRTTDQYVAFVLILKQLDEENGSSTEAAAQSSIGQLETLIRNLTKLVKIHSVYQCPMSYAEYITQNVHSICHRILDRVRAAQSVKEHIEQFVFPYIEEHNLDRNGMLHAYIKELATAYRSGTSTQHSSTWDVLCLQITEQITDINMRTRAVIEIATGTLPPWNLQLSNVVKSIFGKAEKIDPELISKLREQSLYAELGQIFIRYQIPLDVRSRVIGSVAIQQLLRFLFKNGNDKEMATKLQDAFKIVEIYQSLQSSLVLTSVDSYFLYATVVVQQFTDEWEMKPLLDLFQLIKSNEEVEAVAAKLVSHFRFLLTPTLIKKIIAQRLVWLPCLLCVLQRFMPDNQANRRMIQTVRNIQELQTRHQIVVGFDTFRDKPKCHDLLKTFIESDKEKSIVEVIGFGKLLSLGLDESCTALLSVQIRNKLPEAVLKTLDYMLANELSPTKEHLRIALEACTYICWEFTNIVRSESKKDDRIDFSKCIIGSFQSILPGLIVWSTRLENIHFAESFLKINRYIALFSLILDQYAVKDGLPMAKNLQPAASKEGQLKESVNNIGDKPKESVEMTMMHPRLGLMLPHQEGRMFDPAAAVKAISVVAASVVEPPVDTEQVEEFNRQMCECWERLFVLLSGSHVFIEIQARQLANTLPCFNANNTKVSTNALIGMDRHVTELCKKILNFAVADLHLAAHLLGSLPVEEMKMTLQELRHWVIQKKNVRLTLNLIRVSLFLLILTSPKDLATIKQVANWFESTQWQKRLLKHGMSISTSQLKKQHVFDLTSEFAKVLLPSALLKEYCDELGEKSPGVLLNYAVELCKFSTCLSSSPERFSICIETAKAALQEADADEKTISIIYQGVQEICPYNYEAIGVLLNKLQEFHSAGVLKEDHPRFQRINDFFVLMKFLNIYSRNEGITPIEIRWYKQFINPKYYDISVLTKSGGGQAETLEETRGAALMSESTVVMQEQGQLLPQYSQRLDSLLHESNLPSSAKKRLPFHLFLLEEKDAIDKYQTYFIHHEITIYNVLCWITLVEMTKGILQHSRTSLLVGTINSYVREMVKFNRAVDVDAFNQIRELIYDSHNRLSILKGLATRFQRLPLGTTKIALIELCCDVIEKWVKNFEPLKIPAKEHDLYDQSLATMRELLAVLNTEHLLEQNRLLDADTASLTQKPDELINHLFSSGGIDWTEVDCVEKYFLIVGNVSDIHRVDLEDIFTSLIDQWVHGGTEQSDAPGIVQITSADPDSTIDFMGGSSAPQQVAMGDGEDPELSVPILYDHPQTTRIIMLLRKIKTPYEKVMEVYRKYKQDISILPGGYMTKIRIATCILRFLDNAKMQELFSMDHNQFGCEFITLLNQRLYSICRIETPAQELQDWEKKQDFVRAILSPQSIYRPTIEMAHLLLCLVVDNDIEDLGLLSKAAQRMLQLRLPWLLLELLRYIRTIRAKNIDGIANLATYFGRTFETLFAKLDCTKEGREVVALVHFLISCPVEGESQFKRAESMLAAVNANCAASLVAIASDAVADISAYQQEEGAEPVDCDVRMK